MALFLRNVCKFDKCGLVFPSLNELIEHIESKHVDFNPEVMKQLELKRPENLPLSYVTRYSCANVNDNSSYDFSAINVESQIALEHHNYSLSILNSVSSDSDIDVLELTKNLQEIGECDFDEEFSTEFIMRYGSKQCADDNTEKPFACPIPGCNKRYKNVNGIKYHAKNGHKKNKLSKNLKCHCGKTYKTAHGLKNHVFTTHSNGEVILPSTSSLSQPLESLSLLTISRLPSSFDSIFENTYDCKQKTVNKRNRSTASSNMEIQSELLSSNCSAASSVALEKKSEKNVEIEAAYSSRGSNSVPVIRNRTTENDDIIDVGDANDCIYP